LRGQPQVVLPVLTIPERWPRVENRTMSFDGGLIMNLLRELFPVADDRSGLEWTESREVHRTTARVATVGNGGAMILAEHRPPLHQVVRIRLQGKWVQGFVAKLHTPDVVELVLRGSY
jgi:hypothetical protein